jgi:hypothetical protein
MNQDEIKRTIDAYLSLVETGCDSVQQNKEKLKLLLDHLALSQHFLKFEFDEAEYGDAPRRRDGLRKLVAARFPNYGYYNTVDDVSVKIAETGVGVGDAIDDIEDIAADLFETKWRLENNSIADGLFHYRNGFQTHWGRHLRDLQLYLQDIE